jgi:hypothetical protein
MDSNTAIVRLTALSRETQGAFRGLDAVVAGATRRG